MRCIGVSTAARGRRPTLLTHAAVGHPGFILRRRPFQLLRSEVDLVRCSISEALMRPMCIVELEVAHKRDSHLLGSLVGVEVMLSYFTLRHSRSTNTLSIQRPLPSMLMRTPLAASTAVKFSSVNWLPWSVLTISGAP